MRRPGLHTKTRLSGAYAFAFLVLAAGAAVALWLLLRYDDYASIDATLRIDARDVVSNVLEAQAGDAPLVLEDAVSGFPADIGVMTDDGHVVASLGPGLAPADALLTIRQHGGTAPWSGNVRSRSVDERVMLMPVPGSTKLVLVTFPLTELESTLGSTAMLLAEVVAGLVVLASGLGYLLAERALAPVAAIAGLARDLSERDLHRRIDLSLPNDELGELAATFNNMLARLETSFVALRNFTADAAHELRAPLTLMRAELETAMRRGDGSVDRAAGQALVTEIDRLSRIADQLLLMAQADAGRLNPAPAAVDVADLVVERGDRWRSLAAGRGIRLVVRAPDSGTLPGDAELLGRLIDNLLDNAIRHTPGGGMVELAAYRTGQGWELQVADTGPGIPPELRPRLFERFSRPADGRSRQSGGAGLGLALCAAIAAAHNGSIHLAVGTGRGTRFAVRLPAH